MKRRTTIGLVTTLLLLGGCIDHDWQLVRHRIENCIEETFLVPIDDLKQGMEAGDERSTK